jgi:single-strand DNA-binding protein
MSINKVILIGNCGTDPKISNTQDGREIASFTLATSEKWNDKNSGEKKEKTEWHKIVVFSAGLAGVVKNYVKKGSKLYIEGQLQTRKWEKDGVDHYSTEIVLQGFGGVIQLLDSKKGDQQSSSGEDDSFEKTAKIVDKINAKKPVEEEDEIPF